MPSPIACAAWPTERVGCGILSRSRGPAIQAAAAVSAIDAASHSGRVTHHPAVEGSGSTSSPCTASSRRAPASSSSAERFHR